MSHRYGGFVKGFRIFSKEWTDTKSPSSSASAPTSPTNFHYNDAKGIWNSNSTAQFPKSQGQLAFTIVGQTSVASSGANGGGTTTTVTTPSGAAIGDVLIMVVQSGSSAITGPNGWTTGASSTNASQNSYVYYQILTGAPSANYSFTQAGISLINATLIVIRKTAGSPTFVAGSTTTDSSLSSVVFGSVTVASLSAVIAVSFVRGSTTAGVTIPNLPAPYTEISEIINTTSTQNSRSLMVEYRFSDSGSITPATKTLPETTAGVIAMTFAIS